MTYNTPQWEAAKNGLPGDLASTNHANQLNQFLGTHKSTVVYESKSIVTPNGAAGFYWFTSGKTFDFDQAFTLPGGSTDIGRIAVPIYTHGNGADVKFTLSADTSGKPNLASPIASVTLPAQWLTNQAATNGMTDSATSPIAMARDNSLVMAGSTNHMWTQPNSTTSGAASYAAPITSGNYVILLGGYNGTTAVATAATVHWSGGTSLSLPMAQPALPQAAYYGAVAATNDAVLYAGGQGSGSTFFGSVYTASWDPNTGTVGAWSSQTSLPSNLTQAGGAAYAPTDTVYVVGGTTDGTATNAQSTVYYATLSNGAISSWQQGARLPQELYACAVAVVGQWLIVAGGINKQGAINSGAYYSRINTDGSPTGWQYGPTLPTPIWTSGSGWDVATTDSAIILVGGYTNTAGTTTTAAVQILQTTAQEVGFQWSQQQATAAGVLQAAVFSLGPGPVSDENWQMFTLHTSSYDTTELYPMPLVSVPFGVTGLTGGGTYHLTYQQVQGSTQDDQVRLGIQSGALSATDAQQSNRFANSWTAILAGYQVPLIVYDNDLANRPIHTIDDVDYYGSARRFSTINFSYNYRLLGLYEATALPKDPLNSNPTFTTGIAPWVAHSCTFVQSNAQTHGGLPFSGLLTPNGTTATVYAESEPVPVIPGQWYQVNGWVYSPPGYNTVTLSVDWYDSGGTFISVSQTVVTVAAATWTNLVNYYLAPPTAARGTILLAEGLTPAASQTLYLSNATLTPAFSTVLPSIAQVTYASSGWPLTGITQLA